MITKLLELPQPFWMPPKEAAVWSKTSILVQNKFKDASVASLEQSCTGLLNLTYVLCGAVPVEEIDRNLLNRVATMVSAFPIEFLENTTLMSPMRYWHSQMPKLRKVSALSAVDTEAMATWFAKAELRRLAAQ